MHSNCLLIRFFKRAERQSIHRRIAPTCQPIITMTVEAISLLGDLSLHTREAVYPHIIAQLDSLLTSMQDELVNWHKHSGHVEHPAAPFATIDLVHWTCQALFICIRSPAREHACLPTSNAPPTAKMEAETSLLCAKACRVRRKAFSFICFGGGRRDCWVKLVLMECAGAARCTRKGCRILA